jgi:phosphoribosylformimino-5-aminoimidazole carboxamide ribotide isomerase
MDIIPAIDLRNGKCVRLSQGEFSKVETYTGDPVTYALKWRDAGATRIHVVDLDGARVGLPQAENLAVIRQIVKRAGIPIQLGGGIRSAEIVERMLNVGVDRVVLGTAAVQNPQLAQGAFMQYGERVAVGIDARDGKVAVAGWQSQLEEPAIPFAQKMQQLGAKRIIFTDIARDGMLNGPNIAALKEVLAAVNIQVIASGGVSSLADIETLAAVDAHNLDAVIVGKALYAGALDLAAAIQATR